MCAKCEAKNAKNASEECMLGDVSVYAMDTIEPSNKQSIHIYIVSACDSARASFCGNLLWLPFVVGQVSVRVCIGKPLKVIESVGNIHTTHTQVWALQICI